MHFIEQVIVNVIFFNHYFVHWKKLFKKNTATGLKYYILEKSKFVMNFLEATNIASDADLFIWQFHKVMHS